MNVLSKKGIRKFELGAEDVVQDLCGQLVCHRNLFYC